ncbi:MAG: type transport system ATP-binding protein [Thermoleophilaceae bacterium]|nr:type transport system ATP-binding protein [Thermoleophilaceae bacterium]
MRGKALSAALISLCLAAPAAEARDDSVTSFDGTKIVLHWFPTASPAAGGKAPTVLFGPGWAQAGASDPEQKSDPTIGSIGVGALRKAGYNVLTWDPRGFGQSGGTVTVDSADAEGRDVQALIDYVAAQPEAQLDSPGDPRLGMTGASYGGGIQLVVAAIDPRLDAIVPDISWQSLGTSLYKDDTFKGGWGSILYSLGQSAGHLDPHIGNSYREGAATGKLSDEDKNWFLSRGPGDLVKQIHIPTLLTQGTVDTLFTLNEAIENYGILKGDGVPVKMLWFCGGHGSCLTDPGDGDRIERAGIAWLNRYLRGDKSVDTGPGFEWIDQNGKAFSTPEWPPAAGTPVVATGSGTLPLLNSGGSGPSEPGTGAVGAIAAPTNGTRATNAVNVPIDAPAGGAELVGAPRLSITYSGTAASPDTRVYAQLVDETSGRVLGNQVTPLPVTVDGAEHTLERPLEVIAHTFPAGAKLTLQITSTASNYDQQRTTGAVDFKQIRVELPTVAPGAATAVKAPAAARAVRLGLVRPQVMHRTRGGRYLLTKLRASGGKLTGVRVELLKGKRVVARSASFGLADKRRRSVKLRLRRPLAAGTYAIRASGRSAAGKLVVRQTRLRVLSRERLRR